MGLFTNGPRDENVEIGLKIIEAVCRYWNDELNGSEDARPVVVAGSSFSQVNHVCAVAETIFDSGPLNQNPGPYKRAAAFVVLGSMYPIFNLEFKAYGQPYPDFHQRQGLQRDWHPRFMIATLRPLFGHLMVRLDGADVPLPPWTGFPSRHVQLDVTNWIRWLKQNDEYHPLVPKEIDWKKFSLERKIRAVLALSLILEISQYTRSEAQNVIMGRDTTCIAALTGAQELDLAALGPRGNG